MKLSDLEDADQLITRDYLDMKLKAELNALKADILAQLIASERGQRLWIGGLYALIFGTYALMIGLYVQISGQIGGLLHLLQH